MNDDQRPPRKGFDKRATDILKDWMLSDDHIEFPYPNEEERQTLADQTGMSVRQVLNWFVNARKRIWQPLLLKLGYDAKRIVTERKHITFRFDDTSRCVKLEPPLLETKPNATKRKGHWSREEEKYAEKLIQGFANGMLPLKKGTALRTFLASRLNCHPMRISKKFAKQAKLGKAYFIPRREPDPIYLNELKQLEQAFNHRIAKENLVTTKTIALQRKLSPNTAAVVRPNFLNFSDMELMDWTLEWDNWFTPNLVSCGYPL